MKYLRRGSWRVLDRDEFLNIIIIVFYELFVFVLELNQVRQRLYFFLRLLMKAKLFHLFLFDSFSFFTDGLQEEDSAVGIICRVAFAHPCDAVMLCVCGAATYACC